MIRASNEASRARMVERRGGNDAERGLCAACSNAARMCSADAVSGRPRREKTFGG
jgi:hypothetical protein